MKLVHPEIENHILFEENMFTGLVVENKNLFYKLVSDLYEQTMGEKGKFVLSEEDTPVAVSKHIELVQHFIPFELNTKSLLNKILSAFEKTALDENCYKKTREMLSYLNEYFKDIASELDIDVQCTKLIPANIIKAVGLSVFEDKLMPMEKILSYMELIRELSQDKIFVFVNMRAYFSEEELNGFVKTAIAHKFRFFMIDAYDSSVLVNEKRIIIDNDLCEI